MHQKRRDRLESARASLEAEFRTRLIEALRRCERGIWGLFGQNEFMKREVHTSSDALELETLGSEIAQIREELGMSEPFALYTQFLEKRGRKDENNLGEARLAAVWLKELGA